MKDVIDDEFLSFWEVTKPLTCAGVLIWVNENWVPGDMYGRMERLPSCAVASVCGITSITRTTSNSCLSGITPFYNDLANTQGWKA